MELDRNTQRIWTTVHRITRKRIELYAKAEDVSVGAAAARLVHAGFEQHAFIDRERSECSRKTFNENYSLPSAPTEGEGVRVKIPLDAEELSRVKQLADREFESEPAILNRLLLWGFHKIPFSPGYSRAWADYLNQQSATRTLQSNRLCPT